MSWIVSGSCNNCGKCCLTMGLGGFMLENACIDRGEDRCKFYVDELQDGKFGHCLILGRGNKPIGNVKDRFGNRITDEQIRWFEDNCPQFPQACLNDLVAGRFTLPVECAFQLEWVDV